MAKYSVGVRARAALRALSVVVALVFSVARSTQASAAEPAEPEAEAGPKLAEPQLVSVPAEGGVDAGVSARHGSVFVDPLGFALFGPRLGVELGAGRLSVAAHARWFNAGLLSHSLFLSDGDSFDFSYGVGLRARYFLSDGLRGAHLGLAGEYLSSRIANPASQVLTRSAYAVPYAEAGYRLPFGGFYADASAGVGYAFQLSAKVENMPGGSSAARFEASDKSSVYGTASLELGLYF